MFDDRNYTRSERMGLLALLCVIGALLVGVCAWRLVASSRAQKHMEILEAAADRKAAEAKAVTAAVAETDTFARTDTKTPAKKRKKKAAKTRTQAPAGTERSLLDETIE